MRILLANLNVLFPSPHHPRGNTTLYLMSGKQSIFSGTPPASPRGFLASSGEWSCRGQGQTVPLHDSCLCVPFSHWGYGNLAEYYPEWHLAQQHQLCGSRVSGPSPGLLTQGLWR